jgi:hypothetical protein
MTRDEEIIVDPENRDLFEGWLAGEVTLPEAAFIAKRGDFYVRLRSLRIPEVLTAMGMKVYDALFESRSVIPK